jgi:hypothetical protein
MDWQSWHEEYDDPGSRLSRRLAVVQRRLTEILDTVTGTDLRLVSLCGGEARDVIPVLAAHPRGPRCAA